MIPWEARSIGGVLVEAELEIPMGERGRLENNIHIPMEDSDERTLHTACVCRRN